MKTLVQHILEAADTVVSFDGKEYSLNKVLPIKIEFDTIESFMPKFKDLAKQGVQYVTAYYPHYSNGNPVDNYMIVGFWKGKKFLDMYKDSEKYALISTKTGEVINKDVLMKYSERQRDGNKIIRL